jgi:hypothetical protein
MKITHGTFNTEGMPDVDVNAAAAGAQLLYNCVCQQHLQEFLVLS